MAEDSFIFPMNLCRIRHPNLRRYPVSLRHLMKNYLALFAAGLMTFGVVAPATSEAATVVIHTGPGYYHRHKVWIPGHYSHRRGHWVPGHWVWR